MKRKFLIFITIFFSAVFQVSFLPKFFSPENIPNLVLAVIIIWSTRSRFREFWGWAFLAGFILDILSFNKLGIHSLSFLIISFAASFISRRLIIFQKTGSFFVILIFIFFGSFLNEFLAMSFIKFEYLLREKRYFETINIWNTSLLYRSLWGVALGAVLYRPVSKLQKALAKNQKNA